ncbi:peptidase T [Lachnospiraceae bacterium MD308]|nr:peptidase T [Lachnospiraceae bacterium MD308]
MRAYERLLKYITFNTQADAKKGEDGVVPSSSGQWDLANALMEELAELGIKNVELDEKGFIYGSIPSNLSEEQQCDTIGFVAHMDTATTFPGPENTARIIEKYDGGLIMLCEGVVLEPENCSGLKDSIGDDLIVTNGKTLLGADDKAGLAEIMTALSYMIEHPEFSHGEVAFIFTPDEEIGGSMRHIDIEKTNAKYAYTLDGEAFGMVEYQSFCGGAVTLEIDGITAHPCSGKGVLENALVLGNQLHSMLPAWERPEHTEGFDGYYHLVQMEGNSQKCKMSYLLRYYREEEYNRAKKRVEQIAERLNEEYGRKAVHLTFIDGSMSITKKIEEKKELIDFAVEEIRNCGVEPVIPPMRGGTDGVALTEKGLRCPNLGTGSYNHHAVNEFANIQQMDRCVELILRIIARFAAL